MIYEKNKKMTHNKLINMSQETIFAGAINEDIENLKLDSSLQKHFEELETENKKYIIDRILGKCSKIFNPKFCPSNKDLALLPLPKNIMNEMRLNNKNNVLKFMYFEAEKRPFREDFNLMIHDISNLNWMVIFVPLSDYSVHRYFDEEKSDILRGFREKDENDIKEGEKPKNKLLLTLELFSRLKDAQNDILVVFTDLSKFTKEIMNKPFKYYIPEFDEKKYSKHKEESESAVDFIFDKFQKVFPSINEGGQTKPKVIHKMVQDEVFLKGLMRKIIDTHRINIINEFF
eukprot:TRINITY_DN826_c0_g1_i4.p1 TRINITY_DN826_c0_g1~~TRINITY_DN826_c0_g1_i4.p1  ORF type:complete len:288 (-),score=73.67 TRINITY_DN826_c0_g1_i4:60-923(-)